MSFTNFTLDSMMQTKTPGRTGLGYRMGQGMSSLASGARGYLQGPTHAAGVRGAKELFGFGQGIARYIGPLMGLSAAYQGYQEGGIAGAAVGVGKEAALWYTATAAMKMFKLGAMAKAAGAGAGVLAMAGGGFLAASGIGPQQLLRPKTYDHLRKHAKLEMGTPVMDPMGTVSTMRQRSLMAMQNSRINAMGALGSEAMLLHR